MFLLNTTTLMKFLLLLLGTAHSLFAYSVDISGGVLNVDTSATPEIPSFDPVSTDTTSGTEDPPDISTGRGDGWIQQPNGSWWYPATNDSEETPTSTTETQTETVNGITTITNTTYMNNGDQDNDVPTLLEILAEIRKLTKPNSDDTDILIETDDFTEPEITKSDVLPDNLENPLGSPSGQLPSTSLHIPRIGGGSRTVQIDLIDTKYEDFYNIAKLGITAVIAFTSIRGTSWAAGAILTS
jgi:hypothetical protein